MQEQRTAEARAPRRPHLWDLYRRIGASGERGNVLRAAVLGVNDGLVSNLSLVMGVAGAGGDRAGLLIAGVAGLIAGGLSMALGEWISVQSAREMFAAQIATGEDARYDPEELGGSAWTAAFTSFATFALGASVPLLGPALAPPSAVAAVTIAGSAIGLFIVGAAITLVTGRAAIPSGIRQVVIGLAAAGITFAIGSALGIALA